MAKVFRRIRQVLLADVNDLIDQVEDPERIIRQVIREMEENLRHAREGVLDAIAGEKQLARELESHRNQSEKWREKAASALKAGNEGLAREALIRKKEHDAICQDLTPALDAARKTSQNLKTRYREMEDRLSQTRRKRTTLAARQRSAEARLHLDATVICFEKGLQDTDTLARMEDKVIQIEARTDALEELTGAVDPLEDEFKQLILNAEVEDELRELRGGLVERIG